MSGAVQEFHEIKQKNEDRLAALNRQIREGQKRLPELKEEYKTAVSKGDDEKADSLYPRIKELESSLEADKYKLSTVKDVNSKVLKEKAAEVIKKAPEIKRKHKNIYNDYVEELREARKAYAQKLIKLHDIQSDYEDEIETYRSIYDQFSWEKGEVQNLSEKSSDNLEGLLKGHGSDNLPEGHVPVEVNLTNAKRIVKGDDR